MFSKSSLTYPFSWLALGCLNWLQLINGAPGFWSNLIEHHYDISHVQFNNLIVAWETGKLFGCLPDAAADYISDWKILLIGIILGLIPYVVQYLYIAYKTPWLSYWHLLFLNALAGNSTCWISAYFHSLAIRHFRDSHGVLITITSSYSGLSSKLYTYSVEGVRGRKVARSSTTYLLSTCLVIAAVGLAVALVNSRLDHVNRGGVECLFPVVVMITLGTGVYSVFDSISPVFTRMSPWLRAVVLVLVLMLPYAIGLLMSAVYFVQKKFKSKLMPVVRNHSGESASKPVSEHELKIAIEKADDKVGVETNRDSNEEAITVGNESKSTLTNLDFWLLYLVNACGATLGMVYLNNLEKIAHSRNSDTEASLLLAISSLFGFFGRVFSIILSWYTREKSIITSPALTVLLMMPMPQAFFLLIGDSTANLFVSTAIIGTCTGALNATIASTMWDMVGCRNSAVKRTIVLTNIPIGFLVFGYFAALNYEKEGEKDDGICRGVHCYYRTFITWGSICFFGTILSFVLHLRTQKT